MALIQAPMQIDVVAPSGRLLVAMRIAVRQRGQVSAPLALKIVSGFGQVRAPMAIAVRAAARVSVGLRVTVQDSTWSDRSRWRLAAEIGGQDVSALLTGTATVEAEEGAARIAELSLLPDALTVLGPPDTWPGKPVLLDVVFVDAAGTQRRRERLFTGVVDTPAYDPRTRTCSVRCTDEFQQRIERLDRAGIAAILPGSYWSDRVFDAGAEPWAHFEDRLSTLAASYDLDRFGAGRLAPWDVAGTTPHWSWGPSQVLDRSVRIVLAHRRSITTTVRLTVEYRYRRRRQRERRYVWKHPWTLCDYLKKGSTLPDKDTIRSAAAGTGWALKGEPSYDLLPPSGWIRCFGAGLRAWILREDLRQKLAVGATFELATRFVQTVTERYRIEVRAPEAVSRYGEQLVEETWGMEEPAGDEWRFEAGYEPPPAGAVRDGNGDWIADDYDDPARVDAIETLIARARRKILASLRATRVYGEVPIEPGVERHHVARIQALGIDATGKVARVQHTLDIDAGRATTGVEVALFVADPAGVTDDLVSAPARPDTLSPGPAVTVIGLPTHLGGLADSPPEDPDWDGYIGNSTTFWSGAPVYDERFVVKTPGSGADGDPAEFEAAGGGWIPHRVRVPVDALAIA